MEELKKRYGLLTAVCVVVGIVIGSGIFFKAQDVLNLTGGNVWQGVLAWIIGGAIMLTLAATFAIMATKHERVGGVVEYAHATVGAGYAYFMGWFVSIIYYPAMSSVLAWASARYTVVLVFGVGSSSERALFGPECIALAAFYLVCSYAINSLSPKLAGRLQVSATVMKLIAIVFVALVGVIIGIVSGSYGELSACSAGVSAPKESGGLFAAVCSTAFAYEGWIIATSINSEIKNSKKNLPLALVLGSIIIIFSYLFYYVGILGLESVDLLMTEGTSAAFQRFGGFGATLINFFVVVSCIGTLNGLMLGVTRGVYSVATRGGFSSSVFSSVDKYTNMPTNSAVIGLLLSAGWLLYFLGSTFFSWFGELGFDSSELPIITVYPMYIPILIGFMIKEKSSHPVKRYLLPILSIIGSGIMVMASIFRHGRSTLFYLVVFAFVMGVGAILYIRRGKRTKERADEKES